MLLVLPHKDREHIHKTEVVAPFKIEGRKNFFQAGPIFFGGQPDEETLRWIANQGVNLVINLRTEKEMTKHAEEKFDEPALVKELGMVYTTIPLGGDTGYPASAVDELAELLKTQVGNTLIHCASAGRVSHLWMAYLVKYKHYSIDEAIETGKKIKFVFPLEELLDASFTIKAKS